MIPRGLAPAGWHIPSKAEWNLLSLRLGGDFKAGGKLKDTGTIEAGTGLWLAPTRAPQMKVALPAFLPGIVAPEADDGAFRQIGDVSVWWTSTD
jgi:uncharacterized protein (TIGR02145 family)